MPVRRIFVAIDISEDVRGRVAAYISELSSRFPDMPVKWEPPEKLHLTLRFVGNVDDPGLDDISKLVEKAAGFSRPFRLRIRGNGAFEKGSRAVLWIGAEAADAEKYQDPLHRLAVLLDLKGVSRRRFSPHLTIARIKEPKKASGLINAHRQLTFDAGEFEVNTLVMYESKLLPTGSVYSVVRKYAFTG